jgi:hypothetical protein
LLGRRSTTLAIFPATDIAFLTNWRFVAGLCWASYWHHFSFKWAQPHTMAHDCNPS